MKILWSHNVNNPGLRTKVVCAGVLGLLLTGLVGPATVPRAEAAFPGRNGRIVFSAGLYVDLTAGLLPGSYGQLRDFDIFSVSPSGGGLQQLTDGDFVDFCPAWSPDGRRIAFARADADSLFEYDIYVMNADGGSLRNLTQSPLYRDWEPAWSPDGRRILFRSDRAAPEIASRPSFGTFRGDLFVMDADGSNVTQLTEGPGGEGEPAWSPDGAWIAFRDIGADAISLIRSNGSGRRTLVSTRGYAPEWSPDGRRIAFWVPGPNGNIFVVDVDRPVLTNLTSGEGIERWPVWSPDGRYITFVSDRDGAYRLYRMRSDGSQVVEIIDIDLTAEAPIDWGPRP